MENLGFEVSFKDAFNGAEISPSSAVWTNVELGLEKTSGGKMKGRLLFFQLLAAAAMVFAMGIGSVYFLNSNQEAVLPIAYQSNNELQKKETIHDKSIVDSQKEKQENRIRKTEEIESVVIVDPTESQTYFETDVVTSLTSVKRTLPRLVEITQPRIKTSTYEPDAGMVLLAKLRDDEKKFQQDKPRKMEKFWASLGMGAGTFNPNASASNVKMKGLSDAASSGPTISDPSSGTSYSIGVSLARKVAKRIVVQGGISYLSQNSTYTSSTASGTNAFINDYAAPSGKGETSLSINNAPITVTNPYQVNNNLQYMSIPLQAGYIIIDRAFALQVNGGLSTDIFFKNTLTPENSDLDEVTEDAGSDSPYRTLNFSGLLGTELSYKVGDHYRIAVNPGLRYALNSIYKAEVASDTSPITFDVALRFRYVFF